MDSVATLTVEAALAAPVIGSVTFTPTTITEGDTEPTIDVTMTEPGNPVATITTGWKDDHGAAATPPLAAGVYTATATATNSEGTDTLDSTITLTVSAALRVPVIDSVTFTPDIITVGDNFPTIDVLMTDPGNPVATITTGWEDSGGNPIDPTFAGAGTYTATARAENSEGSDTRNALMELLVMDAWVAPVIGSVTFTPDTITEGDTEPTIDVTMTEAGNPIADITTGWKDDQGAAVTPPLAIGVYTATATATNLGGTDTLDSTITLTVTAALLAPVYTDAPPDQVYAFDDAPQSLDLETFNTGGPADDYTLNALAVDAIILGTPTVGQTLTASGIVVVPDTYSLAYEWTAGGVSDGTAETYVPSGPGDVTVTITVSSAGFTSVSNTSPPVTVGASRLTRQCLSRAGVRCRSARAKPTTRACI